MADSNFVNPISISPSEKFNGLVLIVEDNDLNRNITSRQLKRLGFATEATDSGINAIRLLRSNPKKYTAVLMDYALPGMDGLSTTITIRNTISATLPIIGLSASTIQDTRVKCLRAGMNDFLTKPVNIEQLNLVLNKILGSNV